MGTNDFKPITIDELYTNEMRYSNNVITLKDCFIDNSINKDRSGNYWSAIYSENSSNFMFVTFPVVSGSEKAYTFLSLQKESAFKGSDLSLSDVKKGFVARIKPGVISYYKNNVGGNLCQLLVDKPDSDGDIKFKSYGAWPSTLTDKDDKVIKSDYIKLDQLAHSSTIYFSGKYLAEKNGLGTLELHQIHVNDRVINIPQKKGE